MAIIDKPKLASESGDWMVWKYPSEVLRLGSQLNVSPDQAVVVVKGGHTLDLLGPGKYTLSSNTLPLLDRSVNFTAAGKTQVTGEIWYVHTQPRGDLPWETLSPIALVDPAFNLSVNVQCRGRWGGRIQDARAFVTQLVATLRDCGPEQVEKQLTGVIAKRFAELLPDYFARGKTCIAEVWDKLDVVCPFVVEQLRPEFNRLGWELTRLQADPLIMPEDMLRKLRELWEQKLEQERRNQMVFSQPPALQRQAAPAENSSAGFPTSIFARGVRPATPPPPPPPTPAPAPASNGHDPVIKLKKLKQLLDSGLITQQDFDTRKQKILDDL